MKTVIFPLTMIATGKDVVLVSIEGGWGLRKRLSEMGLNEGMQFKILHGHRPGPHIILVGNTRLVLGHGMAHKILVKEINHV
ncbi:MAG: FeoA domain-containing protein [Candidatus Omnitrophota bacterium]